MKYSATFELESDQADFIIKTLEVDKPKDDKTIIKYELSGNLLKIIIRSDNFRYFFKTVNSVSTDTKLLYDTLDFCKKDDDSEINK